MMTLYEIARRTAEPVLPPLYSRVRAKLLSEIEKSPNTPTVLDVGGRKSPYTIGLQASVSIIDLPRDTELQAALNLGVDSDILRQLRSKRSNIDQVFLRDMINSDLPSDSYDLIVSVEVLEHVEDDEKFVSEVRRVLKPGGRFIMTTPNGDFVVNRNPDHKRHYERGHLAQLLSKYFDEIEVEYAIAGGYFRKLGLRSWSPRRPVRTVSSIIGNLVNSAQSNRKGIRDQANGTHHLIARAVKHV